MRLRIGLSTPLLIRVAVRVVPAAAAGGVIELRRGLWDGLGAQFAAAAGRRVAVVSAGDPGVFAMAAAVLGFAVLAASPLPLLVSAVLVLTHSNEFSLMKPGRETIYTRVDRQWRYKAGAAIDTAFFRGGEITFSWTYKALSAFGSSVVFGAGLLVALLMTASVWRLLRETDRLPEAPGGALPR